MNRSERDREAKKAERIVEEETIKFRITSYNVCYTKLLRIGDDDLGRDVRADQFILRNNFV